MKRLIFSIFVEIKEEELDNPGVFDERGNLIPTDKSKVVKHAFDRYADRLIDLQRQYADKIGVEYQVVRSAREYNRFAKWFRNNFPEISKYDIINFYKHRKMLDFATKYDQVCYVDTDIIFNTDENIFDALPVSDFFCVPDSNDEAHWGKIVPPKDYNTCIRNPATKYWNTRALLAEYDIDFDVDVFNTGIMVANSKAVFKLGYFAEFDHDIKLMKRVKHDPNSMYPPNIQRVFNYDNETLFAFSAVLNKVPIYKMPKEWHCAVRGAGYDPNAKVFHVIDKVFERFIND